MMEKQELLEKNSEKRTKCMVVSIAIFSHGKTKTSEVEIPYENIEDFLKALNESVALCDSIPRNPIHAELNSEIGGGA